jgi:plastocyanin
MTHRPGTIAQAVIPLFAALSLALAACAPEASAPADPTSAPPEASEPAPTTTDAGAQASESPASAESAEVLAADSNFDPEELTVAVGTEVVFSNGDDYGHTITEGRDGVAADQPFVDEDLEREPVSVAFDVGGTFQITCRIHPTMNLTVTVED